MSNAKTTVILILLIFLALPLEAPATENTKTTMAAGSAQNSRPLPLNLTVPQALQKYGPQARARLKAKFKSEQIAYPPKTFTLIALKAEQTLLLFARNAAGGWKQVAAYVIVSSSGIAGPKLKEGDLQVPEGFYKVTSMDAITHLCLWVNYPNRADQKRALSVKRTRLGGAIQIHEGTHSTGCVVIGHDDMSELFVLAHDSGIKNIDLIIAPCNLGAQNADIDFARQPKWLPALYQDLKKALLPYPITIEATTNLRR